MNHAHLYDKHDRHAKKQIKRLLRFHRNLRKRDNNWLIRHQGAAERTMLALLRPKGIGNGVMPQIRAHLDQLVLIVSTMLWYGRGADLAEMRSDLIAPFMKARVRGQKKRAA